MTADRKFHLFACCIPVRGARRSVICDLQRQMFSFIPNDLYEILTEHKGKTLLEIKAAHHHECDLEIDEYFSFLAAEELGFWCDNPSEFPDIDLSWDAPERITNAIIDIDKNSNHDYSSLLSQLDDLGCKALQARYYFSCSMLELRILLDAAKYGKLRSVDLVVGYSPEIGDADWAQLGFDFQRLSSVWVHSAPEDRNFRDRTLNMLVFYCTQPIDSPRCCGEVHPAYFSTNIALFTESKSFNSCLNRKLSIDSHGEIKNCPSLSKSYGNARDVSLHSALAHRDFSALWAINKDQIEVCRDCEFRYICTDCRAFLRDPNDRYSKPSKCTYDPYTAKWK